MKLTIIIKKWRSVNDEDDEDTLNILLPVLAASGIVSDAKERKTRDQIVFVNLAGGKMAAKME